MPFRPDNYDGSYCIACRQLFTEFLPGLECPSCGYFDDGLILERREVMAVKIIRPDPDPRISKQVVCGNCGATLEYVPADVKRRDGHDYGGGPDGCEWVDCPQCNDKAIIRSW